MNTSPPQKNEIISPQDAKVLIEQGAYLLDVRTPAEFSTGHLPEATNIPHDQLPQRMSELSLKPQQKVVVYCKVGGRAEAAIAYLRSCGITEVVNAGGYADLASVMGC